MSLYGPIYCPFCNGGYLEWVDSERQQREKNKPNSARCSDCGQGWEIVLINGKLVLSQADSFSKPELKVHRELDKDEWVMVSGKNKIRNKADTKDKL